MDQIKTRTTVILVNFRSFDLTARCILHLIPFLSPGDAIVCIDNNSSETSVDSLRSRIQAVSSKKSVSKEIENLPLFTPQLYGFMWKIDGVSVLVHRAPQNNGFGAGCNLGFKFAEQLGSKYVWFLNNDAFPSRGSLKQLQKICDSDDDVVVGTAISTDPSGSGEETYGFELNTFAGTTRESVFNPGSSDIFELKVSEFLSGCSMFMSLITFQKVGAFEEEYFLYYEETDWQMRARFLDCLLKVTRNVCVEHDLGGSIGSSSGNRGRSLLSELCSIRSRIIFVRRFYRKRVLFWKFFCLLIAAKRLVTLRIRDAFHIARVTLSKSGETLLYILSLHPSIYTTVFPNKNGLSRPAKSDLAGGEN